MIEIESDILNTIIHCKDYHKRVPEYGERAWIAKGKKVDVIYWDLGNTWCTIMDVIPKKGKRREEVVNFYRRLRKIAAKFYDEEGFRCG